MKNMTKGTLAATLIVGIGMGSIFYLRTLPRHDTPPARADYPLTSQQSIQFNGGRQMMTLDIDGNGTIDHIFAYVPGNIGMCQRTGFFDTTSAPAKELYESFSRIGNANIYILDPKIARDITNLVKETNRVNFELDSLVYTRKNK